MDDNGRLILIAPCRESWGAETMKKVSKRIAKKQNALKHGVYSCEVMLPGENRSDYEALRAAHYDEWAPDGVIEECLVDELFMMRWKKRRLDQYDQIRLQQRFAQIHEKNEGNRHRTNLKNLSAEFRVATSIEAVEKILSTLSPFYCRVITQWVPRESSKDLAQWGAAVGKFLSELKTEDYLEGADLFVEIVDPDQMEKDIARSIRLDEAIDRKTKRIIQVKAAKQIFPGMRKDRTSEPKLINAGVGASPPVPAAFERVQDPATPIELKMLAEPSEGNDASTAIASVVVAETDTSEGSAASIAAGVAVFETVQSAVTPIEVLAEPSEENDASPAAAAVVVETDTSEGGTASIATGVAVFESVQNSAAPLELEALAQSREESMPKQRWRPSWQKPTPGEGVSAPVASEIIENGQFSEILAKVEVFTKPEPLKMAELHRYSVLCNELRERHGYPKGGGLAGWI